MDDIQILIDLHKSNARLGPGSDASTRQALELSGLMGREGLKIADLGCGTGASSLVLAEPLDAQITAVDLFPEFLEELTRRAQERGSAGRITTLNASRPRSTRYRSTSGTRPTSAMGSISRARSEDVDASRHRLLDLRNASRERRELDPRALFMRVPRPDSAQEMDFVVPSTCCYPRSPELGREGTRQDEPACRLRPSSAR